MPDPFPVATNVAYAVKRNFVYRPVGLHRDKGKMVARFDIDVLDRHVYHPMPNTIVIPDREAASAEAWIPANAVEQLLYRDHGAVSGPGHAPALSQVRRGLPNR